MQAVMLSVALLVFTRCGMGVQIKLAASSEIIPEGTEFTVTCLEESGDVARTGRLAELSIETISQETVTKDEATGPTTWIRKYTQKQVIKPLVGVSRGGQPVWDEDFFDGSRVMAFGSVRPGNSSLSLTVKHALCSDGPAFICVAKGPQGTIDSSQTPLLVHAAAENISIRARRGCMSGVSDQRCELMSKVGEIIELTCNVRTGQKLSNDNFKWYQVSGNQRRELHSERTLFYGYWGSDSCASEVSSTLRYKHRPTDGETKVTVTCEVTTFKEPHSTETFTATANISICTEEPEEAHSQRFAIGMFFAGCGAMLLLIIVVLLVLRCCCNCRISAERKNQMSITKKGIPE